MIRELDKIICDFNQLMLYLVSHEKLFFTFLTHEILQNMSHFMLSVVFHYIPRRHSPTNTTRGFHVETTWKQPFPCCFNLESKWCVCREDINWTYIRRPGYLLNVLCTFNLRPLCTGYKSVKFHITISPEKTLQWSPFLVWLQTPAYNDITNCKSLPIFLSFSISHLAQPWKLNDKNIEELLQIIISDFKLFYRGRLVHSVLRQGLLLKYAAGFFVCICVIVCICVMFAFISKTECTNLPRYYSTLLWRIYFLHKSFFSNDENLIKLQIYKENQFM